LRLNIDQLDRQLEGALATTWLVVGEEPLLLGEAVDRIRARARQLGFTDRETFDVDRYFDWGDLLGASRSLSLFASQRLLELRMPTPRPGVAGGGVLVELASSPPPDTVVLVVIPAKLERDAQSSAWFKAFEQHGRVVQAWPVEIARLPQWIAARARRHGIELDPAAAELLAGRVEGNLLAAHQEIEKLALTHGAGRLGEEAVAEAVADSARYDIFQLGEAALAGDAARSLRILGGLQAEGTEAPVVLWLLCRELRAVVAERRGAAGYRGRGPQAERRAAALARAVRRIDGPGLRALVHQAARVDRTIKGRAGGRSWDELEALVAALAGALPPRPEAG
jgi:DNA polymerase III subunit delta